MKRQTLAIVVFILCVVIGLMLPAAKKDVAKPQIIEQEAKPNVTARDEFTSPAGIRYGKDWSGKFDTRIAHVLAHTKPDASKLKHSVFIEKKREAIIALIDEAWKKRGPPKRPNGRGRDLYEVDMGRVVGTVGERRLRIVIEHGSADIVTAYPVP